MKSEGEYDSHCEASRLIHGKIYEFCDNCDYLIEEGTAELVEIKDYWGRDVKMSICKQCATPVEITAYLLPRGRTWYIYYIDGLGRNRKEIEITAESKEESIAQFRDKYVETFDRDLIKLIVK